MNADRSELIVRILNFAAAIIEEHGWRRGQAGPDSQGRCTVRGAIIEAARRIKADSHGAPEAFWAINVAGAYCGDSLLTWNDEVCKSKTQAARMLRKAALGVGVEA